MTTKEKLEMYREKESFIRKLDLVLTTPTPKGMSVTDVEYEVYKKDNKDGLTWFQEILVITFKGGGTLPVSISGNSNSANFQVLAQNINGGDYSFKPCYEIIKETWQRVNLDEDYEGD